MTFAKEPVESKCVAEVVWGVPGRAQTFRTWLNIWADAWDRGARRVFWPWKRREYRVKGATCRELAEAAARWKLQDETPGPLGAVWQRLVFPVDLDNWELRRALWDELHPEEGANP